MAAKARVIRMVLLMKAVRPKSLRNHVGLMSSTLWKWVVLVTGTQRAEGLQSKSARVPLEEDQQSDKRQGEMSKQLTKLEFVGEEKLVKRK